LKKFALADFPRGFQAKLIFGIRLSNKKLICFRVEKSVKNPTGKYATIRKSDWVVTNTNLYRV
jgi:hypothetical protein